MGKFTISSLLVLFSAVLVVPSAIAQMEEPDNTRIEKYEDSNQTQDEPTTSESEMNSGSQMEDMEGMESEDGAVEPETRTEETLEEVQPGEEDQPGDKSTSDDVRRTEAFNLVSSAYRGDFEDQGINSYAVLVNNYESGELTAEDLIQAAIESGELSPTAMEDTSYIEAVDSQLNALTES